MRVVFVENHDSFSWNVIELLPWPREAVAVVSAAEALPALAGADAVVVGPGPMDPLRAGLVAVVQEAARRGLPFLGVCLGHQALGLAFGASLARARPAHGKRAQAAFTPGRWLDQPGTREVMRYHSLALREVPPPLRVVARLPDGTVMAVEHEALPMVGVQFHPDSFGTPQGRELLHAVVRRWEEAGALRVTSDPGSAGGVGRRGATTRSRGRAPSPSSAEAEPTPPALSEVAAPPFARGAPPPPSRAAATPAPSEASAPSLAGVAPPATARAEAPTAATPAPSEVGEEQAGPSGEGAPERLALSSLLGRRDFALLAPGFSDGPAGAWTLVEHLRPGEDGVGVWLATAEAPGAAATRWTGAARRVHLVLDVAPGVEGVTLDEAGFLEGVAAVREAIAAGDVYQVNLTLRATLQAASGAALLARLCARGVPPYAAWVRAGEVELVSASPELLVEARGRWAHAAPMKGTAAPGQRRWLEASEKDRAELAMITDLLRDDLHRLCAPGSVTVTQERRLVELPYALQTVADVEGTLRAGVGVRELLGQLHPGGSVTGAPREAACALIGRLEGSPRGHYCGVLALEQGDAVRAALLIRTAERHGASWRYGVGSGITWDSDAAAELAEVRLKLEALGAAERTNARVEPASPPGAAERPGTRVEPALADGAATSAPGAPQRPAWRRAPPSARAERPAAPGAPPPPNYSTLRVTAAGLPLLELHRARFEARWREAFDDFARTAAPGLYAVRVADGRLEVQPRPRSRLADGQPLRQRPSPIASLRGLQPKRPSPGPWDAVRLDGVATLLTSPDGAEVYESCVAAVFAWDGATLLAPPEDRPRVASTLEAWLVATLPVRRAPLPAEGLPLLLANAAAGLCVPRQAAPPPRALVDELTAAWLATAHRP